ncbi:Sm-like ribonucleo protein [Tilletiaria anomala UBC 951]|uniref:U6 snRNA-associated Sm-like protein LSm6 n=1 Tax=Tilletiaria anomala (strain ATCC 24038 / CBS 436.72 / UBC 951) TaxID=1037660 RepID=A0A066VDZ3_TILAU|nr:Sm-like ribonucleoprotein [Tilletiaria anomala UBC 951]KDN39947.1 Sm-like ribonucleo protein [Tilletiaria anomala UBC 951]
MSSAEGTLALEEPLKANDSGANASPVATKSSPNDFLKGVIGKPVVVRLNSGVDYKGTLSCLDGYMNIALEETTEWVNGQMKSSYGDAFIRGNNVLYITAA